MFKKTDTLPVAAPVEPSLSERLNGTLSIGAFARSQFLSAALDLEFAADELDIIAQDVQNELDRLVEVLETAINTSDENRASAKRLRSLVEGKGQQLTLNFNVVNPPVTVADAFDRITASLNS